MRLPFPLALLFAFLCGAASAEVVGKPLTGRARLTEARTFEVVIPAAPEANGLDPEGWFLRVDIDGPEHKDRPYSLGWSAADASGTAKVRLGGKLAGTDAGLRFSAALTGASAVASAGGTLKLTVEPRGDGIDLDALVVTRLHRSPTLALRGKENGKLGPDPLGCGMLGFTALTEHEHVVFSIVDVREGGPADRAGLRPGDVVVAVGGRALGRSSIAPGWEWFRGSHEAVLGRAIETALVEGRRAVELIVETPNDEGEWTRRELNVELPLTGNPENGFPFEGKLGERFRADLLAWTVAHQRENGSWPGTDAVNPALGALALLGTGDAAHAEAIERTVDFLLKKNPKPSEMRGLAYWTIAFQGILFCELARAGRGERLMPWIEEAIAWLPTTTHESKWGTAAFGHGPDGLPYDNKALMAPTAHLLVFDALARRLGLESRIWEHIEPYVRHSWSNPEDGGHGAMGYNGSYRDKDEFWSRTGLVALAELLRADDAGMARALCVLMRERHPWMLNSHAYGEPGGALGLLALSVVEPKAFAEILPQYRWRFLCAWEPGYGLRYTSPHMGAPYMGEESIMNLSYLLLASSVERTLAIAGAK